MTPKPAWSEIERVLLDVLEVPPDARDNYLDSTCSGDPEIRREVERLLKACDDAERANGFLASPAFEVFAPLVAERESDSQTASLLDKLARALEHRYLIEREAGHGGMATVFLARDLRHDRRVAIKVMRPSLRTELGADRFLLEIRTLAGLNHPNILPLHDSGEIDGLLYYVTPFFDGESLRVRLKREGSLPVTDVIQILRDIGSALSYAHAQRVVHRDIKPENILLQSGRAVLADFGIARALDSALTGHDQAEPPDDETMTPVGLLVGTPAYMAPEQAVHGQECDHRADLYSLGVVAYEMLAGVHPFRRETAKDMPAAHRTVGPLPLRSRRDDTPHELASLVERLVATQPVDRYQTADDLLNELERISATERVASASTRRVVTTRWTLAAGAVAAGIAAVLLLAVWRLDQRQPIEVGSTSRLTNSPGLELDPAISPDGRSLVFSGGASGRTQVYLRALAGGPTTAIASSVPGAQRSPTWSPDGASIAFLAGGDLVIASTRGGVSRRLARGVLQYASPAWSPNGRSIAYVVGAAADSVAIVGIDNGARRMLATPSATHSLAWSPDGSRLALVSQNGDYAFGTLLFGNIAPTSIWIVSVEDATRERITPEGHLYASPTWTPDGRALLYVSNRGGALDVYHQSLDALARPRGQPRRLTTGLNAHSIRLSRDGTRVVYSALANRANIFAAPISPRGPTPATAIRRLTNENQIIETVAVSADGAWLAYDSDRSGFANIYKMPTDGGEPVQLTRDTAGSFVPQWSRDGRRLSYHSWRNGNRDVFVMDADGGGVVQVTADPRHDYYADWAPDGRRLVFRRRSYGAGGPSAAPPAGVAADSGIMITTQRGTEMWSAAVPVSLGDFTISPRWTHEGRYLVYVARDRVLLYDVVDGAKRTIVDRSGGNEDLQGVAVGPDTSVVYFLTHDDSSDVRVFYAVPIAGGPPRQLLSLAAVPRMRGDFATDGRRLYFPIAEDESDVWVMEIRRH